MLSKPVRYRAYELCMYNYLLLSSPLAKVIYCVEGTSLIKVSERHINSCAGLLQLMYPVDHNEVAMNTYGIKLTYNFGD